MDRNIITVEDIKELLEIKPVDTLVTSFLFERGSSSYISEQIQQFPLNLFLRVVEGVNGSGGSRSQVIKA